MAEQPPETPKEGTAPAAPKPAAPAAPAAAHGEKAPAVPTGPVGQPWSSELVDALKSTFPEVEIQGFTYLTQNYLILPRESILPICLFLKTEKTFSLLADLTAADYPKKEKRFEVVYQLYSFAQ